MPTRAQGASTLRGVDPLSAESTPQIASGMSPYMSWQDQYRERWRSVPRTVTELAGSSLRKDRSNLNRSTVRGTLATARGSKNGDHPHRSAECLLQIASGTSPYTSWPDQYRER